MKHRSVFVSVLVMLTSFVGCGLPENPAEWSDKQLDKWAENSEWYNALPSKPASVTDKREFATQIYLNPEAWKAAFDFLATHDLDTLKDGKYFLTPDQKTFANVQTYAPREKGQFEMHRNYIDLQYVFSGSENHLVCNEKDVREETLAYSESRDVALYASAATFDTVLACSTCFGLYFPKDAHNPNLQPGGVEQVRKVFVKIPYVRQ